MAGEQASTNFLVLTGRAPDTSLSVQLHPLVLLTISDYITRHTLRQHQGPVIGAIIGQQNGRNYTLEHAYECKVAEQDGGDVGLDSEWFEERLEQYRDVHKVPALDLVAMFMTGPVQGPQEAHLPVLKQVQALTNTEGIMLCLFHPELVDRLQGGKLPITLYESVQEVQHDGEGKAKLRFRELSFEVETGEAEMIGVDFVAKGGGNATAVPKAEAAKAESSKKEKGKGKGKAKDQDEDQTNGDLGLSVLSPEDEELIASLTAKANAIKMLNQRIDLIRQYLTSLPKSYLTDESSTIPPPDTTNHSLLRSVQSTLSRVPLLASPTSSATADSEGHPQPPAGTLHQAGEKERQDVHLTSLLAAMTRSIAEAQNMGAKFHVVQRDRQNKERGPFMAGGPRMGGPRMGEEGMMHEAGGI